MKIADNYAEIISLWNDNYEEMVGEYRIDYWNGIEYPFRHEYNFFNAIIQLENEDWNKAIALMGKYKSKKLEYLMEYKTKWENEVRDKEQNQIFFTTRYIAPAFINFYSYVNETLGLDKCRKETARRIEMEEAFDNAFHKQYWGLLEIYRNVLKQYWRYWKMKKLLAQVQPKFDLFSISLNEGSSLEQLSKSNFKIDKALQELQDQNEKAKLANLLKREDMPNLYH